MTKFQKESFKNRVRQNGSLVISVLIVLLCVLSVFIYRAGKNSLIKAAKNEYQMALDTSYQNAYQQFYDQGEAAYHTNNEVSILIGPIKESSELEVLTVGATVFVHNSDRTVWEEINGTSAYVINLKAGEFAVDNQRKTVYIRLPKPQLKEEVLIDEDHLHVYQFVGDGKINNLIQDVTGSIQQGEADAVKMRKEGVNEILSELRKNNQYFESAKNSAESILKNLVVSVNPNVNDIKVEVDFY